MPGAGFDVTPVEVEVDDGEVVRDAARALHATGGVVVLKGNLAPDGALRIVGRARAIAVEPPSVVS